MRQVARRCASRQSFRISLSFSFPTIYQSNEWEMKLRNDHNSKPTFEYIFLHLYI